MDDGITTFRTRARAIEMLGKDQIANAPTAISELFKNAYDAYSTKVTLNLFVNENSIVLSDNGIGMSENDINNKWLVVGTGDKKRKKQILDLQPGEVSEKLLKREIMGEKGIGRLAIAALGKQLFLISKRVNNNPICLFIDWRIFQHLDLNLDEVIIPMRKIDDINNITDELLNNLLISFLNNFDDKKWDSEKKIKNEIIKDVQNLMNITKITKIKNSNICNSGSGTSFLIYNIEDDFKHIDIDNQMNQKKVFEIRLFRLLLGFRNIFIDNPIDMEYSFNFYFDENRYYNILDEKEWWNEKDIKTYDHRIEGSFDEFGKFNGVIEVFGNDFDYENFWKKNNKSKCGPFEISLRYVEGDYRNSRLEEEDFKRLSDKLNLIGGLYIYRDGIRVLPYGEPDIDFLQFEERRSRGAGRYFFSHRRFFGYIAITKLKNYLKDKSSREGFIENAAYRDFKNILTNFFSDLSNDFFYRKKAKKSPMHYRLSEQHKKEKLAIKEEEERSKKEKKEFIKNINDRKKEILDDALMEINRKTNEYLKEIKNQTKNRKFAEVEKQINEITNKYELFKSNIIGHYHIEKPDRILLEENEKDLYGDYLDMYDKFVKEFDKLNLFYYQEMSTIFEYNKDFIDKEKIINNKFLSNQNKIYMKINNKKKEIKKLFDIIEENISNDMKDIGVNIKDNTYKYLNITDMNEFIRNSDNKMVQELFMCIEENNENINKIIDQYFKYTINSLKNIQNRYDNDLIIGAQKRILESQYEKIDLYYNLAQLGLAVEIIDHELEMLYQNIKYQLKELSKYRKNEKMKRIYKDLSYSFQHLESKHKLMLPLYRKTALKKTDISGIDIYNYLYEFFYKNIEDNFKIIATDSFKKMIIPNASVTIIYPAFINLINNSIYWTQESNQPKVLLDYRDNIIFIEDSGIGIPNKDWDRLFEPFFSRKQDGGRGLGLYITKENLNANGYNIEFTNNKEEKKLNGACFKIFLSTRNKENNNE